MLFKFMHNKDIANHNRYKDFINNNSCMLNCIIKHLDLLLWFIKSIKIKKYKNIYNNKNFFLLISKIL
jgi:hypothetical protein